MKILSVLSILFAIAVAYTDLDAKRRLQRIPKKRIPNFKILK